MPSAVCSGSSRAFRNTGRESLLLYLPYTQFNNSQAAHMNCISFVLCGFALLESSVEKHLLIYCHILSLPYYLYSQTVLRL